MAIIIGGFKQETNTFSSQIAILDDFKRGNFHHGEEIIEHLTGTRTGESGFMDVIKKEQKEIAPTLSAVPPSLAGGTVSAEAWHYLRDEIVNGVKAYKENGEAEAVLLNMHGAMVAEDCNDPEGTIVEAVRAVVGPDVPIGVSLDAHACITDRLIANADIIVGYATIPHVDEYETGYRAAEMVMKMLKGELKPVIKTVKLPMLIAPETLFDIQPPLSVIFKMCRDAEKLEGIESASFFPVHSFQDTEVMTSRTLVIANENEDLAMQKATEIADKVWELRDGFRTEYDDPNEAVRAAMKLDKGTVVLSEPSDSIPAGAPGDANILLKALLEEEVTELSYVIVVDPEATKYAFELGEGKTIKTTVGYKLDPRWGTPVEIEGTVLKCTQGKFLIEQVGTIINMGNAAIIQIGMIRLVVTEHPFEHFDPGCYICLGLDPTKARIVGVKSNVHFRKFYGKLASEIHLLKMPGPASTDYSSYDWKHLPRPMWPVDEIENYRE